MKIDALMSDKFGSAGDEGIRAAANSTYPKVAVQWLNQALCFYQSFCLVESEVLRNRHLRVVANRWQQWGVFVDR
ncbi:MAG: hypothetical protein IPI53_12920 [Saprospiraceae bacterium]|nr:hypothetical protein [Saprospiraceae bacterium]